MPEAILYERTAVLFIGQNPASYLLNNSLRGCPWSRTTSIVCMHYRKSTCVQSARCFSSAALHIHSVLLFFAQGSFAKKKKVCKINKYFCKKKKKSYSWNKMLCVICKFKPLADYGQFHPNSDTHMGLVQPRAPVSSAASFEFLGRPHH